MNFLKLTIFRINICIESKSQSHPPKWHSVSMIAWMNINKLKKIKFILHVFMVALLYLEP